MSRPFLPHVLAFRLCRKFDFNPACAGFRRLKGEGKGQFSCLKLVDRKDRFSLKVN